MNALKNLEDWSACLEESRSRPVLVFKHSTACPISSEAHREVNAYAGSAEPDAPQVYMVRVIEERRVSNKIAEDLGVQHKSPQLFLVKDGHPVWNSSHYGIRKEEIRAAVSANAHERE